MEINITLFHGRFLQQQVLLVHVHILFALTIYLMVYKLKDVFLSGLV